MDYLSNKEFYVFGSSKKKTLHYLLIMSVITKPKLLKMLNVFLIQVIYEGLTMKLQNSP